MICGVRFAGTTGLSRQIGDESHKLGSASSGTGELVRPRGDLARMLERGRLPGGGRPTSRMSRWFDKSDSALGLWPTRVRLAAAGASMPRLRSGEPCKSDSALGL